MNCAETRKLLHAYVDDELDLVRSLEVEQHLKACAQCAAAKDSIRSLRDALQQNDLAYRAPDSLRSEIRKMTVGRASSRAEIETKAPRTSAPTLWLWRLIATGATALAVLTIVLRPGTSDELLNEAVADHVRSLQVNHLTDVASSDQHTVKPWFDGKLDFAPEVKDFAAEGFPLIGGRLDYLGGRTVAALVYHHNKHFINVFVWPDNNVTAEKVESFRGYSVIRFNVNGFNYCLVSDAEGKELSSLGDLLRK